MGAQDRPPDSDRPKSSTDAEPAGPNDQQSSAGKLESRAYKAWSQLCDLLRTSKLSLRYYEYRLSRVQSIARAMDCIIAATGSVAITAWAIWSTPKGQFLWASMTGVAALLGVLRPIFRINDKINDYGNMVGAFSGAYFDSERAISKIRAKELCEQRILEIVDVIDRVYDGFSRNGHREDRPLNPRLRRRATLEVLVEIPVQSLAYPWSVEL